jgi:hypothetical protein
MKNPISFCVFFLFGSFCFVGTWTGVLVDQTCVHGIMTYKTPIAAYRTMNQTCSVNNSTRSFGLILPGGELLQLNRTGNGDAAETIHNIDPQTPVIITGTLHGKTIDVQSLDLK